MRVEVLISAMNVESIDFYKKFNLECDALIINQTDHNAYEELVTDDFKVRMISTDTRGLARSRNLGLLNSKADIIIFADDDEVFEEGYLAKVRDAFISYPDVDFFVFKTIIYQDGRQIIKVKENKKLGFYNCLTYGSVHFAFDRKAVARKNIYLNTNFGAGTENGSGEDSIFILDCIRSGLKARTSTDLIAKVYNDGSTWFNGFNEKFFLDKGKLSRALFPKAYRLYIEQFIIRHPEMLRKVNKSAARRLMLEGASQYGGEDGK